MDEKRPGTTFGLEFWLRLGIVVAFIPFLADYSITGRPSLMLGVMIFLFAVLVGVRWINQRDEPRNAKRPPDPPSLTSIPRALPKVRSALNFHHYPKMNDDDNRHHGR